MSKKKNRNVAIIGCGQSKFSSHREEVNQPEMIFEAVEEALKVARGKLDSQDAGVVKAALEDLTKASHKMAEAMYSEAADALGEGPAEFGVRLVVAVQRDARRRHPSARRHWISRW